MGTYGKHVLSVLSTRGSGLHKVCAEPLPNSSARFSDGAWSVPSVYALCVHGGVTETGSDGITAVCAGSGWRGLAVMAATAIPSSIISLTSGVGSAIRTGARLPSSECGSPACWLPSP